MIRQTIIRVALVLGVGTGIAAAQSASMTLGTVRITQPVLAHGQPLAPGTYDVRLTDESLPPNHGQSPNAVRVVEFVRDGHVIARDAAEVMTAEGSVGGTAGGAGSSKPRVEMRYLIHLPVANAQSSRPNAQ